MDQVDDLESLVALAILAVQRNDGTALTKICASHPEHATEVRRRVDELRARGLLSGADAVPDWIGPYRVLGTLGRGGMGAVYRAEQTEPVQRTVAIKVIRTGAVSDEVVRRFVVERQTMARLQHPNIAQLLDAGKTSRGEPFFVMELIDGAEIDVHCDQQRLNVRQRIDLLATVCDAVQHAHHKGVIHRDLKPSNILVHAAPGQAAIPKVIDFGIAKLLDADLAGIAHTAQFSVLGTPEFMSPEQARGDTAHVDTRTDVFALGVVLYKLLTGALPRDADVLRAATPMQWATILAADPRKPSKQPHDVVAADARRTSARGLQRALRGDIDAVALRALAPEPGRRYASAGELAAELRRILRYEPVLAGSPSVAYRLRKLARRHKAATAAALSLLLGLIVSLVLLVQTRRARQQAEDRAFEAEAIAGFVDNLVSFGDPGQGHAHDLPIGAVLQRGVHEMQDSFRDRPAVRARFLARIGRVHSLLEQPEVALPMLQEAMTLWDASGLPRDATWHRARLALAGVHGSLGDSTRALTMLDQIVHQLEGAPLSDVLAEATSYSGVLLARTERAELAEAALLRAIAIDRQPSRNDPRYLAQHLHRLGSFYVDHGRAADAVPLLQEGLRILETAGAAANATASQLWSSLGLAALTAGDFNLAVDASERAQHATEAMFGASSPMNASVLLFRARTLDAAGRGEEALRAVELACKLTPESNPLRFAQTRHDLAAALDQRGRRQDAVSVMEHALVAACNAVGDRPHTLVAQIKTYLAGAYARAGKLDEAERLLDEVSAMRMALGETAGNKVAVLIERAEIARMRGQFAAGLELIDRGLELAMHVSAATQAMCHRLRAMFLLLQDRPVEGEAPARAALALSPHLAHERVLALQHLGWALRGQGRIDEAMTTFRAAEAELAAHFPAGHWISPFVHGHLGTMLYHADKREEALGHLQRASEEHAASSGRLSNDALTSLSNYATTLTRLGRAEARGVVERAISSFTEAKHDPDPMFMSLLRQASDLAEAAGDLPMALDRALQLVDQQRRTGAPTAIRANTELRVAELQHKLGSPAKSALATAVALAAEVTNDPELQQRIVEVAARLDAGERK